jgi:hypothetical protein
VVSSSEVAAEVARCTSLAYHDTLSASHYFEDVREAALLTTACRFTLEAGGQKA